MSGPKKFKPARSGDALEDVLNGPTAAPPLKLKSRLLYLCLAILGGIAISLPISHSANQAQKSGMERLSLNLKSGSFEVFCFAPQCPTRGVVVLASNEVGWSVWEDATAAHLTKRGYAVAGWDSRKFADSRQYSQVDLGEGFSTAAKTAQQRFGAVGLPLWYAGWSAGAEQAVAAAASASRPSLLIGLLLAGPRERGRFGVAPEDLLGRVPSGPGSFSLVEQAPRLGGLHVAQFAAELDPVDGTAWLSGLALSSRVYHLAHMTHDMQGAGQAFQCVLDQAMDWCLAGRVFRQTPVRTLRSVSSHVAVRQ